MSGSPFHWRGQPPQLNWGGIKRSATNAAASSAVVKRKREAGTDTSTIPGMGRASLADPEKMQANHGGAWSKARKTAK